MKKGSRSFVLVLAFAFIILLSSFISFSGFVSASSYNSCTADLKVDLNFKLSQSLDTIGDNYEKSGLDELKFVGCVGSNTPVCSTLSDESSCNAYFNCSWIEKCKDCGTSVDKADISGIITAYDGLTATVFIPASLSYGVFSVKITINNTISPLSQNVLLSSCILAGGVYTCHADFNGAGNLTRGNNIFVVADLLDVSATAIGNCSSSKLLVAKYNLFTFPFSNPSLSSSGNWIFGQYANFSQLSELNKYLNASGKPVYIQKNCGGSCISAYNCFKSFTAGFNLSLDTILNYNTTFLNSVAPSSGGSTIGANTACSAGFFGPFSWGGAGAFLPFINSRENSPLYQQNDYILAHEMGHRFLLADEYTWKTWKMQSILAPPSIRYGLHNALNEYSNITFPICCSNYTCCKKQVAWPVVTIYAYSWEEPWDCEVGLYTWISGKIVDDSQCWGLGPKPADAFKPNHLKCGGQNVSGIIIYSPYLWEGGCAGTPYLDRKGQNPDSELVSTSPINYADYYFSFMGSPNFIVKRVYPNNAVCPLRNC